MDALLHRLYLLWLDAGLLKWRPGIRKCTDRFRPIQHGCPESEMASPGNIGNRLGFQGLEHVSGKCVEFSIEIVILRHVPRKPKTDSPKTVRDGKSSAVISKPHRI